MISTSTPTRRRVDRSRASNGFALELGRARLELVTRIRRQIELGIYDEDGKVDAAIERLADDLNGR